jgi:transcriptional regulator with XRE-family HTH domain
MNTHTRIKELMQSRGISYKQISDELHVSRSRVSQLLAGDELKQSQIIAICQFLNVSTDYLLFGDDAIDEQEGMVLEAFRKLSPAARAGLLKAINELGVK